MKAFVSRLILAFGLFVTYRGPAQSMLPLPHESPGINFFKGSWKDVLAEAKRQNKPIFLDVYTTWCPPCKRMAKEAFPNPKVGAKFNVHFINYQLDAEKGEGIQIAKQYAVASYPTALYIDPNGGLAYRAVGYSGINGMIDQANHMLDLPQLRTTLAKGDKDYADGKREPGFLKKYLKARQALNRPTQDVLDAYLDGLPEGERSTNETIIFVAGALETSDSKAFDFLIKNRPSILASDLAKQQVAKTVFSALYRVLLNDFKKAVSTNDETLLEKVISNNERNTASANPFMVRPDTQKQETANEYRLKFYKQTTNFAKYQSVAKSIAQNQLMNLSVDSLRKLDSVSAIRLKSVMVFMPDSIRGKMSNILGDQPVNKRIMSWKVSHSLYEIADTYRELGTSPVDWEPALAWVERAIILYRTHESLNTYARLLQKLGRKDEAINAQNEAIREAEKAGWHADAYKNELAQMKGK